MKRRDFLKALGGAGLAGTIPGLGMQSAMAAQGQPYGGTLLFVVRAEGGWFQGAFSDPREGLNWGVNATDDKVGYAGNLKYAPAAENAYFFNKYYQDMLVINGVQWGSNGHSQAAFDQLSGSPSSGMPCLSAIYAKIVGDGLPMPWVVRKAGKRFAPGGLQSYTVMPEPGMINGLARAGYGHLPDQDMDILRQFQNERTQSLLSGNTMPFAKSKVGALEYSRNNTQLLQRLADHMPERFDSNGVDGEPLGNASNIHKILVAMQAGVTVAGDASVGGFDTHTLPKTTEHKNFRNLTRSIDYLWAKAEELGLADRLIVHVASDVGRSASGGGHWTVGSTVIMAKNQPWTNRVVGMSGRRFERTPIDPVTLQSDPNGVQLRSGHVHRALRRILGIDGHPVCRNLEFGLAEVDLLNPEHSSPLLAEKADYS